MVRSLLRWYLSSSLEGVIQSPPCNCTMSSQLLKVANGLRLLMVLTLSKVIGFIFLAIVQTLSILTSQRSVSKVQNGYLLLLKQWVEIWEVVWASTLSITSIECRLRSHTIFLKWTTPAQLTVRLHALCKDWPCQRTTIQSLTTFQTLVSSSRLHMKSNQKCSLDRKFNMPQETLMLTLKN